MSTERIVEDFRLFRVANCKAVIIDKTGRFETLVAFGYLHRLIHKGLIAYNLYFSSVAPISVHAAFEKVSIKQKRMFKTLAISSIQPNEEEFLLMEMSNED